MQTLGFGLTSHLTILQNFAASESKNDTGLDLGFGLLDGLLTVGAGVNFTTEAAREEYVWLGLSIGSLISRARDRGVLATSGN